MNKYLVKIAKEKSEQKLRPHTLRALKKLESQDGLLVDHSMGSGKTLLYLKAIENYQKKNPKEQALIIAPASLTTNIYKEIEKHNVNIDLSRLETLSYEKATLDADRLKAKIYGMVVADESHKLRDTSTKRHRELSEVIVNAKKRLLGTGTSAYNHPADVASLVNLVAAKQILPEGRADFENAYINKITEQPPLLKRILGHPAREIHKLKDAKKLGKILKQHIDHYDLADDPSSAGKFPEKTENIKEVEMSPEQHSLYKYMEGKLPFHLRLKVRMNMPLDKKDVSALQSFSSGVRQVSNSTKAFMPNYNKVTPKIMAAADSLEAEHKKNKKYKTLVYSNFLDSGLNDYSAELTRRGIAHSVYHGGLNKTQKDKILQDYNEDKTRVMLFSSSGTEGLNTKGTRKVQVLEPHFNKSKISQAVARAVRYESHEHLPARDRKVDVEHWHSVFPAKRWNIGPKSHSIDQYLHHNSKVKSEISDQMKELVKEAFVVSQNTYSRARYKESDKWDHLPDPIGSVKRDGGAFFLEIGEDGKPRFISRRPSVKGGYPDRTDQLPRLSSLLFPEQKGNVYHVELIHTGHESGPDALDSHSAVSGILNSLKDRAHATQNATGPVRAVLLDVIHPKLNTYGEKLTHLSSLQASSGDPTILQLPNTKIGRAEILKLVAETRKQGHEGVIVTSLTAPEETNTRIKIKHIDTYNVKVSRVIQEINQFGVAKESIGALEVIDASGRIVCKVGTGFTREQRIQMWKDRDSLPGKHIQIKAMPSTASKLRAPVYNGDADGELDTVKERFKE